jgi:hypothetical protein
MGENSAVERGRVVFGAWKHVRLYQATVYGRLGATSVAGKAGDLLGRLRMLARYEIEPLAVLASDAGISRQELELMTLPALEAAQGLHVQRVDGRPVAVLPIAVDQDDVMAIIATVWEAASPTPEERGAVELLRLASRLPMTPEEALAGLAAIGLDEPSARRAIELAESVSLVRRKVVPDLGTDLLYNEYLFGHAIDRTAEAIGRMPTDRKEALVSLLEELHQNEGRPTDLIESTSPELVKFAVEHGIIEQTDIVTTDGRTASFTFTPRMRGFGVAKDDLPDELDQIRLVIASFTFAQFHATNRLDDPISFLGKLIDAEVAGSAQPIATDYGALEKQQIVSVEPIFPGARNHQFRVVKKDSLIAARDTMVAGEVVAPGQLQGGSLLDSRKFRDPVHARINLARQSGAEPLHEADLLAGVREAAQRTRARSERL